MILGFIDSLGDDFIENDKSRIFFTQGCLSMPGVLPLVSGGIYVWHMSALTGIFGDNAVIILVAEL